MPRRTSSGSKSVVVLPSSTRPWRLMEPAQNRRSSATLVFPAPPWPTRATLRILAGAKLFRGVPRCGSPRGAFFDSVSDRVSDTMVLGGVAWYLASTHGAHAALLPFAVLGASNLVSYERARAEALGFTARGGLMERAERMLLLGAGLAF